MALRLSIYLDPSQPVELSQYDTPGFVYCIYVRDSFAYIGDDDSLLILNISDPSNPSRVSSHYTPGTTKDLVIQGDYAYVADYDYGVYIINIADPYEPWPAGNFKYGAGCNATLDVVGDYAYVLSTYVTFCRHLQIIDISNPANPIFLSHIQTPHAPFGIDVDGDYAYVASAWSNVTVINISNPVSPYIAGGYSSPGIGWHIAVDSNKVYLADYFGLSKLRITYGFTCGDVDDDSNINIFDVTFLIAYLYMDGPAPTPIECGDVNGGDGTINIFDITYLITYLYMDGPAPDCP